MSPLAGQGAQGYPDWQRTQNWDSPGLLDLAHAVPPSIDSGPLDVHTYGYVGGSISSTVDVGIVTFTWYLDNALTVPVGSRVFVPNPNSANPAYLRVPNLGPWLRVQAATMPGRGGYNLTIRIFATNRYYPTELVTVLQYVINQSADVATNTAVEFDPWSPFAGPMEVMGSFDVGNFQVSIDSWNTDGTILRHHSSAIATISPFTYNVVAPFTGWWFSVLNTNTKPLGHFTLVATPSTTGST